VKRQEALIEALPGLNCGLCGAPTCTTFAGDVARGTARLARCVFFSDDRLQELRDTYLRRCKPPPDE
jgi:Na+-translocating ferredoxin:NAD+ oxidoreductase RNF subunit RnfB